MDLITNGVLICIACGVIASTIGDIWEPRRAFGVFIQKCIVYTFAVFSLFSFVTACIYLGVLIFGVYEVTQIMSIQ